MLSGLLLAVVASNWGCEYAQGKWRAQQLDAPCTLLAKGDDVQQIAAFRESWGLDAGTAECARDAARSTKDARGRTKAWQACVEKAPSAFALWFALVEAEAYDHLPSAGWNALEELLSREEQSITVANRLLEVEFSPAAFSARVVLRRHPERLTQLLEKSALHGEAGLQLALPLIEARPTHSPPFSKQEWIALGAAALEGALPNHLQLAAEIWAELPREAREALRARPLWEYVWSSNHGAQRYREMNRQLALALVIAGDLNGARDILRVYVASDAGSGSRYFANEEDFVAAMLAFHLEGRRTLSPWDAAIVFTSVRTDSYEVLAAAVPFLSPYESFAESSLDNALKERDDSSLPDIDSPVKARLDAAHAVAIERLRKLKAQLPPAPTSAALVADDEPARVLAPMPFVERKTPYRGQAGTRAPRSMGKPPDGFWPVRSEVTGGRVVVLATSQKLDPVGEVSPGAYWLLVSKDLGDTWDTTYLGLRLNRPFKANDVSTVPLLVRDTVRLDVAESPIVDKTITFPPIGTRAETVRAHVILEASLSDLKMDSDHDGLSDLVESRLLLDPKNRDTDGDGVPDGDDATPRLADNGAPSLRSEVLNAFFEEMAGGRHQQPGIVLAPATGDAGDALCRALGPSRAVQLDDVRFLVGSPAELAGLKPLNRVVTLSNGELRGAINAFGAFYPMDATVVFSTDNRHAFITWSERWRGGSFRADREENGRWVLEALGSWVS